MSSIKLIMLIVIKLYIMTLKETENVCILDEYDLTDDKFIEFVDIIGIQNREDRTNELERFCKGLEIGDFIIYSDLVLNKYHIYFNIYENIKTLKYENK